MRKLFFYFFTVVLLLFCNSKAFAQFPYVNSVQSGNDFTHFIGSSTSNVTFSSTGALLTDSGSQTRGFYLNDMAFTVDRGFIISFDYIMTGSGNNSFGFGDGLALVLFDGAENNAKMGSRGAGLGYSYTKGSSSSNGLTKGFLAVGIDLYGNFKVRMNGSNEYRNGVYTPSHERDHVSIRGQGNGSEGYPVLITQSVSDINKRYRLNLVTGEYESNFTAPDSNGFPFKLRENDGNNENDINASFGHASYRKVTVNMLPGEKQGILGYYLNVDILHGSVSSKVINDYFIPNNTDIKFKEATGQTADGIVTKKFIAPSTFKIGFTGATGGAEQKNIVRNVSIYLPFSPSIKDLFLKDICKDTPTEISILANSVGFNNNKYSGEGDIHNLGKSEYLDPYSFQFRTLINGIYEDTAQPYVAVTKYGTYEYNPKTMKAIFTPTKGVTMPEFDQVYFTIRNKEKVLGGELNIGSEQFRSNTGTVRLTFGKNCNDVLMVNGNAI